MPLDMLMLVYMCHVRHGLGVLRGLKDPLKIKLQCEGLPCLEKTEKMDYIIYGSINK